MSSAPTRDRFETAIVAAMESATANPMRWGVDDCALWVANIERDVLGFDPASVYRGRYKTRLGAARAMRRVHGAGLLAQLQAVAKDRKWQRIDPHAAQVGDVGLIKIDGEFATVICRKRGWFVGRNDTGITFVEDKHVAVAWSVLPDALFPTISETRSMQMGQTGFRSVQMSQDPISIALLSAIGIDAVAGSIAVTVTTFALSVSASQGISIVSGAGR